MRIAIVDCYVDEPSCLGVPPYISPYIRYSAGIIKDVLKTDPDYLTIDQIRKGWDLSRYSILVVTAGTTVPGKYLGGTPASPGELIKYFENVPGKKILLGPIFYESHGRLKRRLKDIFDHFLPPLFESRLYEILGGNEKLESGRNIVNRFAVKGAGIVRKHPMYPNVICEIETYRGCFWRKCSFCSEKFYGGVNFRTVEGIVEEIKALYGAGVKHFRLGNQSDFFTYMGDFDQDIPRPLPENIERLMRSIRMSAPELRTLHIDNVNPKVLSEYPEESEEVAKIIVRYHTSGDVAAFGMESADRNVLKKNNINADPEEVMSGIRLLNRVGRKVGSSGLPELLPGINFVFGLKGETRKTFELNYLFLKEVLDSGLLLRRINLRQVHLIPGTELWKYGDRNVRKHVKYFRIYKRKIREEIDRPMLERVVPAGRVLKDVVCERQRGKVTFGRQIATYPILVGIPGKYETGRIMDVRVVSHGQRSVTAVEYPLDINTASMDTLMYLPGIGRKRAGNIALKRPFKKIQELKKVIGEEAFLKIRDYIDLRAYMP